MPSKALARFARDLSDSGFRGVVRAYYVRGGPNSLSIEFIIYRRPSAVRGFWTRLRRAVETVPSLIAAMIIGFILALIMRWLV
ncbi:MAG: sodium:solute symporter [Vulcanisaeta sp.]|uniref:sodium:solute symporter n=1 Tax=Vulcanisaeta sp. TaxID=2020871 RepID=UPI003D0F95A6